MGIILTVTLPFFALILIGYVAAKLLLHPAIVWVAMTLIGVDDFTRSVAVLTAALPSAGWVFIFAVRYGADAGKISATILISTALAFVTFSAMVLMQPAAYLLSR